MKAIESIRQTSVIDMVSAEKRCAIMIEFDILSVVKTVPRGIAVVLVIIITLILVRVFRSVMGHLFRNLATHVKIDETHFKFLKHFISAMIIIGGFGFALYLIPEFKTLGVSLFAGAGVVAVIVGFASQQAFSNVVAGLFIVIFRPFRVGDRVAVGTGKYGVVEDITLRHTVIRDFQNKRIIIPNSIISEEIIENATLDDEKICRWIEFGISYDSDIDKAKKIIVEEALKHPKTIDNRTRKEIKDGEPIVQIRLIEFEDSSVKLRAYVWAKDMLDSFVINCDMNESVKKRFDKEGIEIPYPYRTVVYKKGLKKKSISKKSRKTVKKVKKKKK